MKEKLNIELGIDNLEINNFKKYLENIGHNVKLGKSTADYIEGKSLEDSRLILNKFWNDYCRS